MEKLTRRYTADVSDGTIVTEEHMGFWMDDTFFSVVQEGEERGLTGPLSSSFATPKEARDDLVARLKKTKARLESRIAKIDEVLSWASWQTW